MKSTPDITLRPLALADLPRVAAIHRAAFNDRALTRLGLEAIRRYYEWQLIGPHDVVALGAADGEREIIGFCFGGIFRGALSGFVAHNRAYLIRTILTHPWLLSTPLVRDRVRNGLRILRRRRESPATRLSTPTAVKSFGILAIAVDPASQGRGVGRALMDAAEAVAVQRGFAEMHLTVGTENDEALRFYMAIGWQQVAADGSWKGIMRKVIGNQRNNQSSNRVQ